MASKAQQRQAVVNAIKSREGKNKYTQSADRTKVGSGYGDCSSTTQWAYKTGIGLDIGVNTEAQINSKAGKDVNLTIKNGIPDESKMLPGDCLYFRGNDRSRTRGVGHVEMYIGNGQIMGHGSGVGPTRKNMSSYCASRQAQKGNNGNKGLICVRRFIDDTVKDSNPTTPATNMLGTGITVNFTGNKHFTSSTAAVGKTCKSGKAKITAVAKGAAHPYHIIGFNGCTAHGWVNASDIAEASSKTGKIVCTALNLRSDASQTSRILATMKHNETFTVLGTKNGWYKVYYKGITGYCSSSTKYVSVK